MKIGLVCPYNIYKGGGVQECVRAIQVELENRGHIARIVTPLPRLEKGTPPPGTIFIGGGAQVRSPFATTTQVSVSVNIDSLQKILEEEKFDVLHFHEPWVPILSRQILSKSRCPNVATFHAKLPDTLMSKTIEKVITPYTKSVLKDLDCLTAVSSAAEEYVKSLTIDKIHIIPNGIDLSQYKQYKKSPQTQTKSIVYIGRLERRKGVRYLLKAFQVLQETDKTTSLIIAGDGVERSKLEQRSLQMGLKNVQFLGFVSDKEKLELLNNATVFCSPALFGESFGIVLLEAMAMQVPVVAGNNPGYRAVLQQQGGIGLVNPKFTKDFATKLSLLLHDDKLRSSWQTWAKQYVKQFNYKTVVDKYEALYESLVKL